MNRFHIAAVAALLALAAVLGTFAAVRTSGLGNASRQTTNATFAARSRRLSSFEARLRRELAATRRTSTPPARVVFHRPPAVVVVHHSSHHDDGEGESTDD
jgi:hypothetical protein